ncbi:hypothetical protein DPMN_104703 [Dreissena polymorpha]|uniref:Uncharacterized protein n=1 Tax=Dreissena polymorpha TaxID=45954 RepID=A0A9D4H896_DREPO|nr:hypothetical protein DPMN_104703 [Dreissena polymorpha]
MSYLQYQVGDLVWFLHEGRQVGISPKLEKANNGPFPVVEKRRSLFNFTIMMGKNGPRCNTHHNKMNPTGARTRRNGRKSCPIILNRNLKRIRTKP